MDIEKNPCKYFGIHVRKYVMRINNIFVNITPLFKSQGYLKHTSVSFLRCDVVYILRFSIHGA